MSGRTGLSQIEVAVLEAVEAQGARPYGPFCHTMLVLDSIDQTIGLGPRYGQQILADMVAPWVRHLPLLDGEGNWGSLHGDSPADGQYTELRPSPVGQLALESERGTVGPLPLGLIEGTLYRGGKILPFDPTMVVKALLANAQSAGPPRAPTGMITGPTIHPGRDGPVFRVVLSAVIRTETNALVITEPPYGISLNEIIDNITSRVEQEGFQSEPVDEPWNPEEWGLPADVGPNPYEPPPAPVLQVQDHTSGRTGTGVVCLLKPGADPVEALDWIRGIWPVTLEMDCVSDEEMLGRFATWDRSDLTGLQALERLLPDSAH